MLHGMLPTETDQVRGISILAPVIEIFFNLYDYLDYELLGAILAASFPVAITSQEGPGHDPNNPEADPFDEVRPGQVVHLRPGEDIAVPQSNRPSNSFQPFTERLIRAAGAACGQPYERVAKDFSKTNYSSARAALLEAWKGDRLYQGPLVDTLCHPTWNMALEEFYLIGQLDTPKGLPGFYEAFEAWCNVIWIPPARGSIDPKKTEEARALALANGTGTRTNFAAEDGEDIEELTRTQAYEARLRKAQGLPNEITVSNGGDKEEDSAE
jgi:lambda family phage portal protein